MCLLLRQNRRGMERAMSASYAKHLVDIFNKDEKIVQYCLAREYTTFVNDQEHFKDLRILNRDLVIVESEDDA